DGFKVRPEAAAGLPKVLLGGRKYVFTVRRGLRFSDRSPLTAENFKEGLQRSRDPAMHSEAQSLFSDVKSVSARGHRLVIVLNKRSGSLLTRLALSYACPVPIGWGINPAGAPLLVGSGPYYVVEYHPGRQIVEARNPEYHGSRPRHVGRVVITIGGNLASNVDDVEHERADVVGAS